MTSKTATAKPASESELDRFKREAAEANEQLQISESELAKANEQRQISESELAKANEQLQISESELAKAEEQVWALQRLRLELMNKDDDDEVHPLARAPESEVPIDRGTQSLLNLFKTARTSLSGAADHLASSVGWSSETGTLISEHMRKINKLSQEVEHIVCNAMAKRRAEDERASRR